MINISIPASLRPFTKGEGCIKLETSSTIYECLQLLCEQYPNLQPYLLDHNKKVHAFTNIYLNDRDIRQLQHEQTPLQEGDTINILPSIAGG